MLVKRKTLQRKIILETLQRLHTHPTVEEIYAEVHKEHSAISKSTVYRNLRQLADSDEIRQVTMPGDLERYDGGLHEHYHFKCKQCGNIFDIDSVHLPTINNNVEETYGFKVDHHDVVFSGTCRECGELKKQSL